MRLRKLFALFIITFIPFFSAGAIGASYIKSSLRSTLLNEGNNPARLKNAQVNILLIKKNDLSRASDFPEAIDVLIYSLGETTNHIRMLHIYPTAKNDQDILWINQYHEYTETSSDKDLSRFISQQENLALNGTLVYDHLTQNSLSEWLDLMYPPGNAHQNGLNFIARLCKNAQIQSHVPLINLNVNALIPNHMQFSADATTRFMLIGMQLFQQKSITCELVE